MAPAQSPPGTSRDDTEPAWLTRNYYSTFWMQTAVSIALCQILFSTYFILVPLVMSNRSALQSFLNSLTWFLITQPLVTYCYIYLGVMCDDDEMGHALKRLEQYVWSNLLHIKPSWWVLRICIYHTIFLGVSYEISLVSVTIVYLVSLPGVGFCYSIVMVALVGMIRNDPHL